MREVLLYIWQLPQNLVGLLMLAIVRPEDIYDYEGEKLCYSYRRMRGGISLGKYIIVRSAFRGMNDQTEKHELGHARQSRILGPLYLLVIGLPSLLWALWWRERDRGVSYYSFYTERWADTLGGVTRDE